MVHGVHAQPRVDQELRQEAAHVPLEMLVEQNVRDLCLRHEHVEAQSVSFTII